MAGLLGVLLETTAATQQQLLPHRPTAAPATTPAQIIVRKPVTIHATAKIRDVHGRGGGSRCLPMSVPAASARCSFLQRCFLCRTELAHGMDIYIYRGNREFCSEECRGRHILVDQDDDCARVVVPAEDCPTAATTPLPAVSLSEVTGHAGGGGGSPVR